MHKLVRSFRNLTVVAHARLHRSSASPAKSQWPATVAPVKSGSGPIPPADHDHFGFPVRIRRIVLCTVFQGPQICRFLSRVGNGAHRAPALHPLRISVCAAPAEQSGHQLHESLSQSRNCLSAFNAGFFTDDFSLEIYRIDVAGLLGVSVPDCPFAGGFWPDPRGSVAFLPYHAAPD